MPERPEVIKMRENAHDRQYVLENVSKEELITARTSLAISYPPMQVLLQLKHIILKVPCKCNSILQFLIICLAFIYPLKGYVPRLQ